MCLATKKLACAWAADKLSCVNYSAPARKDGLRRAFDLNALKHRIIHAHVVRLCADHLLFVRVKNHEVGVRSNRNGSFARIETKEFCGRGGDQFDEAIGGESLSMDSACVDEAETVLDARAAVRNFREVVLAQFFLLLEAKRAVVGGNYLQRVF